MPAPNLDRAAKQSLFAPQTGEVWLTLLEINDPGQDPGEQLIARVVNDLQSITSLGRVFDPFPFELSMPADKSDEVTVAKLRIDNILQEISTAIRLSTVPPSISLEVILASDPDTIQLGPLDFIWQTASWDTQAVEGDLYYESLLDEPFPGDKFVPAYFPSLFQLLIGVVYGTLQFSGM